MKINKEYIKNLLELFELAPTVDVNISYLSLSGIDYNTDEFVFHMRILQDGGFVVRSDNRSGFGLVEGADGYRSWGVVPLRLTSNGHDFIEALRQKEVWEAVKSNFKDASLTTLADVAKQLAAGFAKKKVKDITGIDLN
ncbi:DUF2513 domain-containing protein [Serratia marcescens]|nr:DUF2513 domain-containing protein [Serratia marcescens]